MGAAVGYGAGRFFVLLCRKLPLSAAFFPLLAVSYALLIYGLTNQFGGSGFLAVYLMGFLIGNARLPQIQQILRMHDGLAWLSQIIMFLMLGLLVTPSKLMEYAIPALILALVMIFIARPIAVFLSLVPFHFPKKDQVFISWVGLRGAVPIILALFPWLAGVPNKDLYFNVAFFVVIVSLLIQGWSIAPVARWLKLEVPPEPGPDHSMTLDSVASNDLLQVLSFKVGKGSPIVDSDWQQLNMSPDVSYLGVLRKGEWIKAEQSPSFQLNDMLLVLSKAKDVKAVSDKVSTSAEQTSLDKLDFFGDFALNGEITLNELDGFYSIQFTEDQDPTQSLSEYITEKFHRRVVVGDQVQLDQLVLTVRQIDDHDQILQVGIKSA
mgnify:FL=1